MNNLPDILRSAVALAVIAGVVTAALAGTNALTEETIARRNEEIQTAARRQVIEAEDFERRALPGTDGTVYYEALRGGETVGYVFTASVTGKSSGLVVMTGITAQGKISGVTVTEDNETAGYVDKVIKGGLLDAFRGLEAETFLLGEDVDGVSQATKTSRGVTDGVNQAVAWYEQLKGGTPS